MVLRNNDFVEQWDQLRADRIAPRVFRHADRPLMMGDHLPHKICIDAGWAAGVPHFVNQMLNNPVALFQIGRQLCGRIGIAAADLLGRAEIFNTPFLCGDNIERNILQRDIGGIPKQVFRHRDRGTMVRKHFPDKIG